MATRSRTSMREVAERAGVAMSSVSRVLSDHPDVSAAMRERVMTAVEELGYHPDILAQSLRRRETLSIGFVVGDISNPLLAEITLGAETRLRAAGYSMLLTNSENDPDLDARHIRLLQQRRVDGLLLSLAAEDHADTIAALRDAEGPCVLIDRELTGLRSETNVSAVLSDHATGMHAAVDHLLELGHRRIALVLGPELRFSRERRRGLEKAYADRQLEPTYTIVEGSLSPEHGELATRELLGDSEPPTALVAGGNQILIGTLQEIRNRGLRIGDEISLISCDSISLTELFDPPIAVVRRDNQELGRRAAELLLQALAGEKAREPLLLPTEFVPRPSCAPPHEA